MREWKTFTKVVFAKHFAVNRYRVIDATYHIRIVDSIDENGIDADNLVFFENIEYFQRENPIKESCYMYALYLNKEYDGYMHALYNYLES